MFLETILDDLETFLLFTENYMNLKCQILLLSQTLFVKVNKAKLFQEAKFFVIELEYSTG